MTNVSAKIVEVTVGIIKINEIKIYVRNYRDNKKKE